MSQALESSNIKKNNLKIFFALVKMYFGSIGQNLNGTKKKSTSKSVGLIRKIFKSIGILIMYLFLALYFGAFLGFMNFGLYTGMEMVSPDFVNLLFPINVAIISILTFFISLPTMFGTYYAGKIEEQFLSMPIKPTTLLSAKIFSTCLMIESVSLVNFIGLAVVFTIKGGAMPILFYLWSLIVAVTIPIPVILIGYLFVILLMRFTKFFKSKNVIMVLGTILGIAFVIGIQFLVNTDDEAMMMMNKLIAFVQKNESLLPTMYKSYLPLGLSYVVLSSPNTIQGFLNVLGLIAIAGVGFWLLVKAMSRMYITSLIGFDEKKVTKLENTQIKGFLSTKLKQNGLYKTLFKREFLAMIKEPVFLMNGPLAILIMPIIMGAIFYAKNGTLEIPPELKIIIAPYIALVFAGAATLLSTMNNVAETSISRDAKFLTTVKSLPLSITKFLNAKFLHATMYSIFGIVITTVLMQLFIGITIFDFLYGSFIALSYALLSNCIGMFIDTIHPSLNWDNPTMAVKQNFNVLFSMLAEIILAVGLGFLMFILVKNKIVTIKMAAAIFGFISLVLFIILYYFYLKFANKKINTLEL